MRRVQRASIRLGMALALVSALAGAARAQVPEPMPLPPPAVPESVAVAPGRLQVLRRDIGLGLSGTIHTFAAPARWSAREWLALPAGAVGLIAISRADAPVEHAFDRNHYDGAGRALSVIEPFGAEMGIGTVVAAYGAGLLLDRPGLRRAGVEAAVSSVVASGVITPTLKLVVGRARPRQHEGALAFHGFSGDESFPSGHTTLAFAAASVFAAEAHPAWAKVLIYGIAGGIGAARMYHDAHFLSDVVAGAAIGTVTGRAVVAWGHGAGGPQLTPFATGAGVGAALTF